MLPCWCLMKVWKPEEIVWVQSIISMIYEKETQKISKWEQDILVLSEIIMSSVTKIIFVTSASGFLNNCLLLCFQLSNRARLGERCLYSCLMNGQPVSDDLLVDIIVANVRWVWFFNNNQLQSENLQLN